MQVKTPIRLQQSRVRKYSPFFVIPLMILWMNYLSDVLIWLKWIKEPLGPFHPLEMSILIVIAPYLAILWVLDRRDRAHLRENGFSVCVRCQYPLRALPVVGQCPECGEMYDAIAFRHALRARYSPSRWRVINVSVLPQHRLQIRMDDGTLGRGQPIAQGVVDLSKIVGHGLFESWQDDSYFAKVRIDQHTGALVWPNGIVLCPETLHEEITSQWRINQELIRG